MALLPPEDTSTCASHLTSSAVQNEATEETTELSSQSQNKSQSSDTSSSSSSFSSSSSSSSSAQSQSSHTPSSVQASIVSTPSAPSGKIHTAHYSVTSSSEDEKELRLGSLYEMRTQGQLSLRTLHHVKDWEDLIYYYTMEECIAYSAPKYSIPQSVQSSMAPQSSHGQSHKSWNQPQSQWNQSANGQSQWNQPTNGAGISNNRHDIFSSPKGSFFAHISPSPTSSPKSSSSPPSPTPPSSTPPEDAVKGSMVSLENVQDQEVDQNTGSLYSGVVVRYSDGRIVEGKIDGENIFRSLSIKNALDKERVVALKNRTLFLLDYAYFSIGQKAYYAPKNFGIFLFYEPENQRMLWLKTFLSFNQVFSLVPEVPIAGHEDKSQGQGNQ